MAGKGDGMSGGNDRTAMNWILDHIIQRETEARHLAMQSEANHLAEYYAGYRDGLGIARTMLEAELKYPLPRKQ